MKRPGPGLVALMTTTILLPIAVYARGEQDTQPALRPAVSFAAIRDPAVNKRMVDFGVEPVGNTSVQFADLLRKETTRWQKLIRDLKITLD